MARQTELTCPSGLRVKLRSIKGKDLDGLRDRRRLATGEAISTLLNDCTVEVIDRSIYAKAPTFDWADVLVGDRMQAVIGLRQATTGPEYGFRTRCVDRDCRTMIDWTVNLGDLAVLPLSDASKEVFLNAGNKYTTTVDGRAVEFGLNTGRDQLRFVKALEKVRAAARGKRNQEHERVLFGLMSRISSVEGVTDILQWLEELDLVEIQELRKAMEAVDCGVQTGIDIICTACGLQQELDLPLDSTFFGGTA